MTMLRRLETLTLLLGTIIATSSAQTITGTITGTITDPTGAVITGAKITATNTQTGVRTTTVSNESGAYVLPFLAIGRYSVTVEARGFKTANIQPFGLEVAQTARVDVRMQVGEISQTVDVTDVAPVLQTDTTHTGDTISSAKASTLPLNGRNFVALSLLIPGAVTPNPTSFTTPSRAFSGGRPYVNGNREQTNNFLLEGIDVDDPIDNLVGYNPNVDAIGEMKVITGNAPAEFGNSNGAIVNVALKSGTNALHGDLFEFLRNDRLDANSFFSNRSGAQKRALRMNTFGGTLGGPIVRDRTFFFIDYQGTRNPTSGAALASVALAPYRVGDLSAFSQTILDPVTKLPFRGNVIPRDRIVNPVAKALFSNPSLYPLPNATGTGPIGVTNNYISSSGNFLDNDQADAKIDTQLTDSDRLSGRFTIARYRSGDNTVALPVFLGGGTNAPTTGGVLNWTRTLNPQTVNEARFGFNRVVLKFFTTDPSGVLGANGNQTLGIPGSQPIAGASSVSLGDGLSSIGAAATDSSTYDNTYQFSDNFIWQRRLHTFKAGFQIIRYQQNRFYAGNNGLLGTFSYTGDYTGSAFADFLLDDLRSKGRGSQTGLWGQRQSRIAAFFQDDFKLRPDLVLNLGLRWEYAQPLIEVADRQSNINLVTGQQLFAGKDGNSRALYDPYYRQFMPRVGVAWTPPMLSNKFVVRAGYGITSFMEGTGANLRLPLNPPFFFESNITYDLASPGSITSGFTDVQPQNQLSGQVRAWIPNLRPAFIQQWNVSGQYEFTKTLSFTAGYVGQRGTHLVDPREFNQPMPGTGPVDTWLPLQQRRPLYAFDPLITNISGTDSSSTMSYRALQLSARKRLASGLEFLSAYTYSRSLTDNLGYYGSAGVASEGAYWQNAYDRKADWGPAFFDARHVFSLGGYYELPFGRDKRWGQHTSKPGNLILGNWAISYLASLHSGFPITILSSDVSNQAVRGSTRPDRFLPLTYTGQTIDQWFGTGNSFCLTPGVNDGTCAYGVPALGMFGNAGVGTERAPAFKNLDFALDKKFSLSEFHALDFRAEFFNILNHPNFGPPDRSISSPATFGVITSTIGSPRNIQFGLKYTF